MPEHIEAFKLFSHKLTLATIAWQLLPCRSRMYPVFFPSDFESAVVFFIINYLVPAKACISRRPFPFFVESIKSSLYYRVMNLQHIPIIYYNIPHTFMCGNTKFHNTTLMARQLMLVKLKGEQILASKYCHAIVPDQLWNRNARMKIVLRVNCFVTDSRECKIMGR